jgi:penicillin-binding protein 1A
MVGGRDFTDSEFNRAVQARRQPGSVFKPFAYLAAIDNGYLTTHQLLDVPAPIEMLDGTIWNPPNYDGTVGGKTTLREGLFRSRNQVTARLVLEEIPPQQVVDYARRLGITTPLLPVYSIALGTSDVIVREIVSAFGVFANRGILQEPLSILMIEDKDGTELEKNNPKSKEVLSEESAYIMVDMLKSVLNEGKGTGITVRTVYGFQRPAGGKTGTTNDWTDAWFVGFTPHIVAGVWVGVDNPAFTLGKGQAGAVAALPIWARFMKAAHDSLGLPPTDFVQPDGVVRLEICNETKMLATESCPDIVEEVFLKEYQPTKTCEKHRGINRRNRKRRIF